MRVFCSANELMVHSYILGILQIRKKAIITSFFFFFAEGKVDENSHQNFLYPVSSYSSKQI